MNVVPSSLIHALLKFCKMRLYSNWISIAAAAERGDRIHLREEARFALEVEADPPRALRVARDNWNVQKELADARLLAKAAVAAREPAAAEALVAWAHSTGVRDAELDGWLRQLEEWR